MGWFIGSNVISLFVLLGNLINCIVPSTQSMNLCYFLKYFLKLANLIKKKLTNPSKKLSFEIVFYMSNHWFLIVWTVIKRD